MTESQKVRKTLETDRQKNIRDRHKDKQNKNSDRQNKYTDRRTDRHTYKQTHTQRDTY